MKRFFIFAILMISFSFSACESIFNDTADELGEYNYFLVANVAYAGNLEARTIPLSSEGIPDFSNAILTTLGTGTGQSYSAATPNGKYLYIPDRNNNRLMMYSVGNSGVLTPLGSPNYVTTGTTPYAVKVHPSGKFLYVTNSNASGNISVFNINNNGTLSSNSSAGTLYYPTRISIHPSGSYLYTIDGTISVGGIKLFSINNNGTLTSITNNNLINQAGVKDIAIHSGSNCIYVTRDSGFDKYKIKSDGTIDNNPANVFSIETSLNSAYLAIDSSSDYLYYASFSTISSYKINPNNTDSFINSVSFGSGQLYDIAVHPHGTSLFVSDFGNSHVYYITINSNGLLSLSPTNLNNVSYGLTILRQKK
jgi:6-phosphogluconolactonase (cycloisomerase 2 family)